MFDDGNKVQFSFERERYRSLLLEERSEVRVRVIPQAGSPVWDFANNHRGSFLMNVL